jgi:hypothetical protein
VLWIRNDLRFYLLNRDTTFQLTLKQKVAPSPSSISLQATRTTYTIAQNQDFSGFSKMNAGIYWRNIETNLTTVEHKKLINFTDK